MNIPACVCETSTPTDGFCSVCGGQLWEVSNLDTLKAEAREKFKKEFWKLSGIGIGELERKQDSYIDDLTVHIYTQAIKDAIGELNLKFVANSAAEESTAGLLNSVFMTNCHPELVKRLEGLMPGE